MYKISDIENSIINGDIIENLKKIPSNSINLIFADPPYFMQTNGVLLRTEGTAFSGVNDDWDKFDDYEHYDNFCKEWLLECRRILKSDGTIFVIGAFQNIYRIGYIMQNIGFWILNDVIWSKPNPVPNFKGTRFTNASETMLWCSKSQNSKYTFNYKTMKHLNGGKQMKSVWNIGLCIGTERIKNESGKKAHSTQKPEELLFNCIISASRLDDIVLDPFMGTGTTGAVAKRTGRKFIGIEREKEYVDIANKRINCVTTEINSISQNSLDRKIPLVSMKELVNKNYLKNGDILYSKNKNQSAILKEDGNLVYENNEGSIHKISALILNLTNNNGWDFWNVEMDNKLISIDEIRNTYRNIELKFEKTIL
jgi:site-specific DNA-methyltransferase (adenine-specific)